MIAFFLLLIVAAPASLITFFVVRSMLRDQLKVGPPNFLAALIAGLAFLGLASGGPGLLAALLIPYAALAIALLGAFLTVCVFRRDCSRAYGHQALVKAGNRILHLISTYLTKVQSNKNSTGPEPPVAAHYRQTSLRALPPPRRPPDQKLR